MKSHLYSILNNFKTTFSGCCSIAHGTNLILSEAYSLASRDYQIPNNTDTMFDTASVTKVYTAVAVLLLIEEGKLHLDDRITKLIDLSGTKISGEVTIFHLLTHTSGIADDADEEAGEDYSALFIDSPNYAIRCCADILPNFAYKDPVFPPGTNVRYNNCAFVLLGLAIEKLSGIDYRTFVKERILLPLGLTRTAFCAKDEVNGNIAEGYFPVKDERGQIVQWKKNIYSYPPVGTADGGIYISTPDMIAFFSALKSSQLLRPESTEMLFKPQSTFTREHAGCTWRTGFAFEFLEAAPGDIFCMYKEGGCTGADAMLAYYPRLDITLALASNENRDLWSIYRELRQYFYELHKAAV